jgi:hypothetical protein
MAIAWARRIAQVLAIHFDPDGGTPYWLERQDELGIDVRADVRSPADLMKLGPMDEASLARRPIEDFIPRSQRGRRSDFIIGETAGTLGRPKYGVHRKDEFHAAFVEPFLVAARRATFPRELNWLFVGPSGPHIIGKAASACARAMGSADPFTIDLDPRWAKKLPPGTFGWRRYVEHVEAQALSIVNTQEIGVIFSTPIVLESLGRRMSSAQLEAIRGIHLGGVSVPPEQRLTFARLFPRAVILSGYGNSLFGMMPELAFSPDTGFDYYPLGLRQIARIVPPDGGTTEERLQADVPVGQRGQVVMTRLDETQLIVNLMERDEAQRLAPPTWAAADGFVGGGVRDPRPIVNETIKPALGLY